MKKLIAFLTVFILLLVLMPTAYAAGSISWKGPETVRAGDSITLTFSAGGGIYGGSGSVSYDKNQLTLKNYSASIGGSWEVEFNGDTFVFYDSNVSSALTSTTAIFKVTFTVKADLATGEEISVTVKNVKLSDGNQDISMGSKTYKATIAPPLSGNCTLASMTVSNAKISPAFSPNVTSYTASVPFTTASLNISADAEHPGAKVSVKSPKLTAGGTTTVSVTVKAENGATKTYSIKVKRAQDPNYVPSSDANLQQLEVEGFQLSPAFAPEVTEYYVWLPYETDIVTLLATQADEKASVEIPSIADLQPGVATAAIVTVTAENGSQKEYTIRIVRAPAHEDTDAFLQGQRPEVEPTEPAPTEPAPAQPQAPAMPHWGILVGCGAALLILGIFLGVVIKTLAYNKRNKGELDE